MNKVVLAGLALILARDCDIGGPRFRGPIQGTWGGENAGLIAFDTTAHVHIGCTAGDTKQAIVTDAQGRFDTPGRYNITLYPVARGPDHPARFTGSTDGHMMTLTVTLTDTTVTLGPVRLERHRRIGERHGESHHVPVGRAGEPRRMVRTAGHGIERDVVAAGRVEAPLCVGHDRLLRITRGAADVDVSGRVEGDQAGVLAAPRALDRPAEARAPDITVADEDQGETGEDDLVHGNASIPSTPAPSSASPAAPEIGRASCRERV